MLIGLASQVVLYGDSFLWLYPGGVAVFRVAAA